MTNRLPVNRILPFANVDGDGNRFSIFVQGCNLNCLYCHNPETISLCTNCGICVPQCPEGALSIDDGKVKYESSLCIECDTCLRVCPESSSPKALLYSKDEILDEIRQYRSYLRGVTVSGGEPTLYGDFLAKLFPSIREMGLSTYVDTNGYFDLDRQKRLIEAADGFLYDVKAYDELPLANLRKLLELKKIIEVRTVVMSDFMNAEKIVSAVSKELAKTIQIPYRLIRVHKQGVRAKNKKMIDNVIPGMGYMENLAGIAKQKGLKNVVIT